MQGNGLVPWPATTTATGRTSPGIVVARAGNGVGVAGVAPNALVLPVKVLKKDGSGVDAAVARGICFAVAHRHA